MVYESWSQMKTLCSTSIPVDWNWRVYFIVWIGDNLIRGSSGFWIVVLHSPIVLLTFSCRLICYMLWSEKKQRRCKIWTDIASSVISFTLWPHFTVSSTSMKSKLMVIIDLCFDSYAFFGSCVLRILGAWNPRSSRCTLVKHTCKW